MQQDAVIWIAVWGLVATGSAAIAGILAFVKNRDYSFWMGASFIFPPMVIILAAMSKHVGPRPRQPTLDEEDKNLY